MWWHGITLMLELPQWNGTKKRIINKNESQVVLCLKYDFSRIKIKIPSITMSIVENEHQNLAKE